MRLCEECGGLLKRLSERYFEFERAKVAFYERRRRFSKEIVVGRLKIPEKMYDKWERELITSTEAAEEETSWRTSKNHDHVTITGGDRSMSSEARNVAATSATRVQEEEIKTEGEDEGRRGNFFEEIEIEPESLKDKQVFFI